MEYLDKTHHQDAVATSIFAAVSVAVAAAVASYQLPCCAHYALEATPTKIKSTGRSEGCSDIIMTSPVTKKISKSGHWGILRKSHFSIFYPALPIKQLG